MVLKTVGRRNVPVEIFLLCELRPALVAWKTDILVSREYVFFQITLACIRGGTLVAREPLQQLGDGFRGGGRQAQTLGDVRHL